MTREEYDEDRDYDIRTDEVLAERLKWWDVKERDDESAMRDDDLRERAEAVNFERRSYHDERL